MWARWQRAMKGVVNISRSSADDFAAVAGATAFVGYPPILGRCRTGVLFMSWSHIVFPSEASILHGRTAQVFPALLWPSDLYSPQLFFSRAGKVCSTALPGAREAMFMRVWRVQDGTASVEKRRTPAWTDRVLWRPTEWLHQLSYTCAAGITASDHRPVAAAFVLHVRVTVSYNAIFTTIPPPFMHRLFSLPARAIQAACHACNVTWLQDHLREGGTAGLLIVSFAYGTLHDGKVRSGSCSLQLARRGSMCARGWTPP